MVKRESQSNVNRVIEDIANRGIVDKATIWETQDMQPENLLKLNLSMYMRNVVFAKGWRCPEEVILANNFNIKEALRDTLQRWKHEG